MQSFDQAHASPWADEQSALASAQATLTDSTAHDLAIEQIALADADFAEAAVEALANQALDDAQAADAGALSLAQESANVGLDASLAQYNAATTLVASSLADTLPSQLLASPYPDGLSRPSAEAYNYAGLGYYAQLSLAPGDVDPLADVESVSQLIPGGNYGTIQYGFTAYGWSFQESLWYAYGIANQSWLNWWEYGDGELGVPGDPFTISPYGERLNNVDSVGWAAYGYETWYGYVYNGYSTLYAPSTLSGDHAGIGGLSSIGKSFGAEAPIEYIQPISAIVTPGFNVLPFVISPQPETSDHLDRSYDPGYSYYPNLIGTALKALVVLAAVMTNDDGAASDDGEEGATADEVVKAQETKAAADTSSAKEQALAKVVKSEVAKIDFEKVPSARVNSMVDDGLAFRSSNHFGYVYFASVVGDKIVRFVLQEYNMGPPGVYPDAYAFRVVWDQVVETNVGGAAPIDKILAAMNTQQKADQQIDQYVSNGRQAGLNFAVDAFAFTVNFVGRATPLVGTAMAFAQDGAEEGFISLAGDAAFFATFGASKVATTSAAGARALRVTAVGVQGGIGAYRSQQAYFAIQHDDYVSAAGYMGEAMLRFIGVSKGIVDEMKDLQAARAAAKAIAPRDVSFPNNTPSRVFSGGREYVVTDQALMNSTKNKLATFYEANKPAGARLRFGKVEGGNGYIDPLTGDIWISKDLAEKYPQLVDGAVLEELYHFQQFKERGWIGKVLTDAQIDEVENEVVGKLLQSGLKELH